VRHNDPPAIGDKLRNPAGGSVRVGELFFNRPPLSYPNQGIATNRYECAPCHGTLYFIN
jgi:hypothetical protein